MSVAWPCNFGRNAILKHRESFASGSLSGKLSDKNVQATENASLELPRVRMSAPRRCVAFQSVSIRRRSQQGCEVLSGRKDLQKTVLSGRKHLKSATTFRS